MVRFVGWLNLNIILKIIVMEHKVLYDTPNGFQTSIYNTRNMNDYFESYGFDGYLKKSINQEDTLNVLNKLIR